MLIVTPDSDYAEHLSSTLAENYANTFEVNVCSTAERLKDVLTIRAYDVALIEPTLMESVNLSAIRLPLLLLDDFTDSSANVLNIATMRKYQRISAIAGDVLERYASVSPGSGIPNVARAHVTAVWAPAGGVGTTTVALALATHYAGNGKQALYLELQHFSGTPLYFGKEGKSISTVFGKLNSDIGMLARGIRQQDSGTGIYYFARPDNYDDINILTTDDIERIISACGVDVDELVIDLPDLCDERTRKVFELADRILIVTDVSRASHIKLEQFVSQHSVYERMRTKSTVVLNKGSAPTDMPVEASIKLPFIQSKDSSAVFKTLSSGNFGL